MNISELEVWIRVLLFHRLNTLSRSYWQEVCMKNWSQRLSERLITRHDINLKFFIIWKRLCLEFSHVSNLFFLFLKLLFELSLMFLPSLVHIEVKCFGFSYNGFHRLSRLGLSMQLREIRHWLGMERYWWIQIRNRLIELGRWC